MTSIPADIQKAAEIAVFAFEARIQGGEFEGLDPNGTEARDALKAEIAKALMAERERVSVVIREARSIVADVSSMASPAIGERLSIGRLDAALSAISPQPSPPAGA